MPATVTGPQQRGGYSGFVSLGLTSSDVRFGSLAAPQDSTIPTAAFGRKAVVPMLGAQPPRGPVGPDLVDELEYFPSVRFSLKRSFGSVFPERHI